MFRSEKSNGLSGFEICLSRYSLFQLYLAVVLHMSNILIGWSPKGCCGDKEACFFAKLP